MVENAEFYDIFVHYQYADCATAQYEPNMHTKRHMLHRTLNTAEPSDAYVSLYGQSQEALNARSTNIHILAVQARHAPCPGVFYLQTSFLAKHDDLRYF